MDHRHHRASRDVQVIIVEVPSAGSPAPLHRGKPPTYKRNQWSPWRPQTRPPSKAEATKRLFDAINRNDQAAREYMAEARRRTA
jgi:hypothetical protein